MVQEKTIRKMVTSVGGEARVYFYVLAGQGFARLCDWGFPVGYLVFGPRIFSEGLLMKKSGAVWWRRGQPMYLNVTHLG